MDAMRPTRVRLLVGLAVIAAAVGWGLVQVVDAWTGRVIPVPGLAAGALWILAAAVAYWAFTSRPRLQRRPGARPMPPIVAARSAALAMAASRIGALVGGLYAGIAIAMATRLVSESATQTFWSAVAATVGAVALVTAALWLEHLCRLPIGPSDGTGA